MVSTHAPRAGGDLFPGAVFALGEVSTHAPRAGGDKTDLSNLPNRYSVTGAVKGVVIQQVEVLPEELTVHLGS